MKRFELKDLLNRKSVNPVSYDLMSEGKDEAYCVEQVESGRSVFYSERGHRNFEHVFDTEEEACEFILKEILQDPTTRSDGGG